MGKLKMKVEILTNPLTVELNTGVGSQGVPGESFHVVNDFSDLVDGFGNNGDTAITIVDGYEFVKDNGAWGATGRNFWGDLLPRAETAVEGAEASALLANKWAENPVDVPVVDDQYSALHWATKTKDTGEAAISDIATAKTDALTAISTDKNNALTEITTAKDGALSALNTKETDALEGIGSAKESALTEVNTAKDGALTDIGTAKTDALDDIEVGVLAAKEFSRLAGLSADAAHDDMVQTVLDVTQTGQDRLAVAQDKADIEVAIEVIRTIDGVYIWQSSGLPIPVGRYIATASAAVSGIFDHMSMTIPSGSGSALVQLLINDQPLGLAIEVSAGAPVNLTGQSINIARGDTVSFAVLIGTASQLWAQITGLLK